MNEPKGIKKRVEEVLRANVGGPMTISEILRAMDLDNTFGPEVNSALHKLRTKGQAVATNGPASSNLGPRWVKRYVWATNRPRGAPPKAVKVEIPRRVFNF